MSTTKNQNKRYLTIDRCLNNSRKKYWTKQELMEEIRKIDVNVTERTLDKDIYDMRYERGLSFENAPIEYCRKHKGYHYTSSFSITLPLDDEEIHSLELAMQTLAQYQHIPYFRQFGAAIDKVIRIVTQVKEGQNISRPAVMVFEKIPKSVGYEHLEPILQAIENRQPMALTYQKFRGTESFTTTIHPYFVKEYRNRWYVVAWSDHRAELRTYGLDRIKAIAALDSPYRQDDSLVPEEYFRDCIGINMERRVAEKIVLQFSQEQSPYIRTQELHRSQRIISDGPEGALVELQVMINRELVMQLLSYGDQVKVIAPDSLISEIRKSVALTASLYETDQSA